jgi:hypothetical protein
LGAEGDRDVTPHVEIRSGRGEMEHDPADRDDHVDRPSSSL